MDGSPQCKLVSMMICHMHCNVALIFCAKEPISVDSTGVAHWRNLALPGIWIWDLLQMAVSS